MALFACQKRRCEEFLSIFSSDTDPTWGFYVYGTYTRPQGLEDANSGKNSSPSKAAVVNNNAHF
ncbi:hypothetical protein P153DRAFT_362639 [Dothidotthia symphoricarpi CBS 119687]|uniref:Uncharacterized protein n=1 Tax=Dothidotthia symphoricarpi CBS 119687 TaxID=1392245 RepID=A0A6A6AUN1_9PLEO|nr:uncharacterized protein P153DRAFT_362639 [Dothidotthia symphoricarpi CBS 119687]KAF2134923.1 hypothetical protein P153DRAFT_362639 [Dothidotthia symphoricarpi CBS 119687]